MHKVSMVGPNVWTTKREKQGALRRIWEALIAVERSVAIRRINSRFSADLEAN